MNEFVIVADTGADLGVEMVKELGVAAQPMLIVLDGKEFRHYPDCREMDIKAFYDALRAGKPATTSAVNAAEFVATCTPILEAGKDVLLMPFSSGLSATCASAFMAADELREAFPDRKILVPDTLCVSLGQGLLIWHAAQMQARGADIDTVFAWVEENHLKVHHSFTVEDLHHLRRGGRVSMATAVVGSMLSIKPILHVDSAGQLKNVDKARGRTASLKALVDRMEQEAIDPANQYIFISHGDCRADADALADMIRARFGTTKFYINPVGPLIGAHAGPGVVALFYMGTGR